MLKGSSWAVARIAGKHLFCRATFLLLFLKGLEVIEAIEYSVSKEFMNFLSTVWLLGETTEPTEDTEEKVDAIFS